jgi:predicted RNA-binding protein (virulence factor B family)
MEETPVDSLVQIGRLNSLKILKHSDYGVFLDGGDLGEILLPSRYVPDDCDVDDVLEVFICYDSEDRLMATTEVPLAMVGDFAHLKVVSMTAVGAFLDWGLPKDLFLPFSEQTRDLSSGQDVVVFVYLDKSQRISASMRLERNISKEKPSYEDGQAVDLFITAKTDLGYKAVINGRHWGVLYANEVFQELTHGQRIKGYIKKMREDGKIDLALLQAGHKSAADIGERILQMIEEEGGSLPVNDKTSAEDIYQLFGVSKKKFKMAIGGLYKKRKIVIHDDGIELVKPQAKK